MTSPFTLEDPNLGICKIAADDVSDSSPVIVYLKVASMLCHDLLEVLNHTAVELQTTGLY